MCFAVLTIAAALVGYNSFFRDKVSSDPKELFHQALISNLSENGITCTVTQTESGTKQQLIVQLDIASKRNAHSALSVDTSDTSVQTEEIVVQSGNYLRYTGFKTTATGQGADAPDYTPIVNQWIKADRSKPSQLYEQTALGGCVVPLAKLPTLSQSSLSRQIESDTVFVTNFASTEQADLQGQRVRRYSVQIMPEPYAAYMREVATAAGLQSLQKVDAAEFANKTPREAIFSVNITSGRLVDIEFTDQTRTVRFSDFGKIPELKVPSKVLTNAEANTLVDL
jgi:hypothetical protein